MTCGSDTHRRCQGWAKGTMPPQFLENIVILCFEKRFSEQDSVIRLKSNILAPLKYLGRLRHWRHVVTARRVSSHA